MERERERDRYSLLTSRLTVLLSHAILNKWLVFHSACFYIHLSGVPTALLILLLRGWCHVKLLPLRCTFCVHHTTMHAFTVSLSSRRAIYVGCMCVKLYSVGHFRPMKDMAECLHSTHTQMSTPRFTLRNQFTNPFFFLSLSAFLLENTFLCLGINRRTNFTCRPFYIIY